MYESVDLISCIMSDWGVKTIYTFNYFPSFMTSGPESIFPASEETSFMLVLGFSNIPKIPFAYSGDIS